MGHHSCEQGRFVQSEVSRRSILKGVLAGAAAAVPAAVEAKAPTDQEQLEMYLAQIRKILARMYQNVSIHHSPFLDSRDDGSYRLTIQGDVKFQPFQGDGIYLVSRMGWVAEYLVHEEPVVTLSGEHAGYSHYYGRLRAEDGGWVDRLDFVSCFVKKIGEVPT